MDTAIYLNRIEEELAKCCDEYFYSNSSVAQATKYSLLNAGKRIRAVLLFLTADMCGKRMGKIYPSCMCCGNDTLLFFNPRRFTLYG